MRRIETELKEVPLGSIGVLAMEIAITGTTFIAFVSGKVSILIHFGFFS
tara:strand:- start:466 stop:612 length:147 start_codon:yes stop_codon:yes gene_type:complete